MVRHALRTVRALVVFALCWGMLTSARGQAPGVVPTPGEKPRASKVPAERAARDWKTAILIDRETGRMSGRGIQRRGGTRGDTEQHGPRIQIRGLGSGRRHGRGCTRPESVRFGRA